MMGLHGTWGRFTIDRVTVQTFFAERHRAPSSGRRDFGTGYGGCETGNSSEQRRLSHLLHNPSCCRWTRSRQIPFPRLSWNWRIFFNWGVCSNVRRRKTGLSTQPTIRGPAQNTGQPSWLRDISHQRGLRDIARLRLSARVPSGPIIGRDVGTLLTADTPLRYWKISVNGGEKKMHTILPQLLHELR